MLLWNTLKGVRYSGTPVSLTAGVKAGGSRYEAPQYWHTASVIPGWISIAPPQPAHFMLISFSAASMASTSAPQFVHFIALPASASV